MITRRLAATLAGSSKSILLLGPRQTGKSTLGPIASGELDHRLDTRQALATGTLPGILTEREPAERQKTLRSYAATYLKEEVQAESLTRNLEGFARFLSVTAEWAGQYLDITRLAAAAQVPRQSANRYFEILEDTLIVHRAEPFTQSPSRRLVQHPKFCFFDVGVRNGLLGSFEVSADRIGLLFEQLVASQILASAAAADLDIRLSSYRTSHGAEVDLLVERGRDLWAIELKASRTVSARDLGGLRSFAEFYGKRHRAAVWYLGDQARVIDGVDVLPWQDGLRALGW